MAEPLPGLWACGEVAANGLHGGNRLASNSLLEASFWVSLRRGQPGHEDPGKVTAALPTSYPKSAEVQEPLDLTDIRNSLSSLMFRDVGIERSRAGLENAIETTEFWSHYVLTRQFDRPAGWELQNMITVAGLMMRSALEREESRGTHYREDFPTTDDRNWRFHLATKQRPFRLSRVPFSATMALS
ncbi:MAG: FAD-binding protein [Planctomycetota bacterium]